MRAAITRMEMVATGHVHMRTKVCGKPNCRCALDPDARHGPYYQWSRREEGRQRHSVVTPEQARLLEAAIDNYRRIQSLLQTWEAMTVQEILKPDPG